MLTWIAERMCRSYEQALGENMDYMRDIYRASMGAFVKFGLFMPFARHRKALPVAAAYAARIASVHAEDCGPCLQIAVNQALEEGVDPAIVRACVARDIGALPAEIGEVYLFAEAVVNRTGEEDPLRERIAARWGDAAIVDLTYAIATARVFPIVKRSLGYGQACQRVSIGGQEMTAPAPQLGGPHARAAE